MAGDWIPMRTDLADDPAVISIGIATGLPTDAVVGKLHKLWSWAGRHTTDGRLHGVPVEWIDGYVGRKGFALAMTSTSPPWLIVDGSLVTIPNFLTWNGKAAKARLKNGFRQQMSRSKRDNGATKARPEYSRVHILAPAQGAADWKSRLEEAKQVTERLGKCGDKRNRRLVLGACVIAAEGLGKSWLDGAVRETCEAKADKPYAFLRTVLIRTAESKGIDFRGALSELEVPDKYLEANAPKARPLHS